MLYFSFFSYSLPVLHLYVLLYSTDIFFLFSLIKFLVSSRACTLFRLHESSPCWNKLGRAMWPARLLLKHTLGHAHPHSTAVSLLGDPV